MEGRLKGWLGDSQFHSFRGRASRTVGAGGVLSPSTFGLRNIRGTVTGLDSQKRGLRGGRRDHQREGWRDVGKTVRWTIKGTVRGQLREGLREA